MIAFSHFVHGPQPEFAGQRGLNDLTLIIEQSDLETADGTAQRIGVRRMHRPSDQVRTGWAGGGRGHDPHKDHPEHTP